MFWSTGIGTASERPRFSPLGCEKSHFNVIWHVWACLVFRFLSLPFPFVQHYPITWRFCTEITPPQPLESTTYQYCFRTGCTGTMTAAVLHHLVPLRNWVPSDLGLIIIHHLSAHKFKPSPIPSVERNSFHVERVRIIRGLRWQLYLRFHSMPIFLTNKPISVPIWLVQMACLFDRKMINCNWSFRLNCQGQESLSTLGLFLHHSLFIQVCIHCRDERLV